MRPGDEIVSIDGLGPFVNDKVSSHILALIYEERPQTRTWRLKLRRPSTGRTRTETIKPGRVNETPESRRAVSKRLLTGDVAYNKLPEFGRDAADHVTTAVNGLRDGRTLHGVILDLRGNGGGDPEQVTRLLGAFAHGKTTSYFCDVHGNCTTGHTDDTVPLLNLPLVVLTDRGCGSACEDFSTAVKDLKLGPLVGTRTAGEVAGPSGPLLLDDNSLLILPPKHYFGTNKEIIDTIGVAPDHYVPMTADALSAGKDPALAKALSLL
nr:S41 family peptidase [Sphaerisporangium perillae]